MTTVLWFTKPPGSIALSRCLVVKLLSLWLFGVRICSVPQTTSLHFHASRFESTHHSTAHHWSQGLEE